MERAIWYVLAYFVGHERVPSMTRFLSYFLIDTCIVACPPHLHYESMTLLTCSSLSQLILVWTPGKSSPVHDHANAHCVMKILKGSLTETIYHWPCQSRSLEPTVDCSAFTGAEHTTTEHSCSARGGQFEPTALRIQRQTTYETDGVTYMSDRLGLHRVGNASATEVAVSLHLYTVCLPYESWSEMA